MMTLYRIGLFVSIILLLASCGNLDDGELVGTREGGEFLELKPYGMVSIPAGSFSIGQNEEDVLGAYTSKTKTISLSSFWMDETEITNDEYRQFVYWVKDSIIRQKLSESIPEFLLTDDDDVPLEPQRLNWRKKIDMDEEEVKTQIENLYVSGWDVIDGQKEIDSRKLIYSWSHFDYAAAVRNSKNYDYSTGKYKGNIIDRDGNVVAIKGRSSFVVKERDFIYPDTLCWVRDFTYSYNEPFANAYFSHTGYDNYPVVGVSWRQSKAFCNWRTMNYNRNIKSSEKVNAWRLPTEFEWEYASRGGLSSNIYPWGGPYTRNEKGCFLANFKPLRGNYMSDGALRSFEVAQYPGNGYGLFDMAGNVAEWTNTAYSESGYDFIHDMNPDYQYNALNTDPPALKRKVIRGGSWKDIGVYLQCGTRTFEYQDTTKSYIGFRCVRNKVND
jgi:formylglycine-generating enzyme required for sulfatase activity